MPPNNAWETSEGGISATAGAGEALELYALYRVKLEAPYWPAVPPEGTLVALGPGGPGLQVWRSTGISLGRGPSDWAVPTFLAHPDLNLASDDVYHQALAAGVQRNDYAVATSAQQELRECLAEDESPETSQTGTYDNEWSHDRSGYHHTANLGARQSGEDPLPQAMQGLTLDQAHVYSRHGNVQHAHGDVPYTQQGSATHTQPAPAHPRPGAPAAGVNALLPASFDSRATDSRQQGEQRAGSDAGPPRTQSPQGGPRRSAAR